MGNKIIPLVIYQKGTYCKEYEIKKQIIHVLKEIKEILCQKITKNFVNAALKGQNVLLSR
ncbi:hypothetical protein GMMP15_1030013 [Candidatus Magnetomoraceae bacterium gMMP-15]